MGLLDDRVTVLENNPVASGWEYFNDNNWYNLIENGKAKYNTLFILKIKTDVMSIMSGLQKAFYFMKGTPLTEEILRYTFIYNSITVAYNDAIFFVNSAQPLNNTVSLNDSTYPYVVKIIRHQKSSSSTNVMYTSSTSTDITVLPKNQTSDSRIEVYIS